MKLHKYCCPMHPSQKEQTTLEACYCRGGEEHDYDSTPDRDTSKLEQRAEVLEQKIARAQNILRLAGLVYKSKIQPAEITRENITAIKDNRALWQAELGDLRRCIAVAHQDCEFNPCKQCMERARWSAENRRES